MNTKIRALEEEEPPLFLEDPNYEKVHLYVGEYHFFLEKYEVNSIDFHKAFQL